MSEKIYDEQIAPLVAKVIELCQRHKIGFFAEFEYSKNEFSTSIIKEKWNHPIFSYYAATSQCVEFNGINIDKYMMWVTKEATKTGHSSIILKQLGVPLKPKTADSRADSK